MVAVAARFPITAPPTPGVLAASFVLFLFVDNRDDILHRDRTATRAAVLVLVFSAVAVDVEEIHEQLVRARSRASPAVPFEDIAGIFHRIFPSSGELLIFLFPFVGGLARYPCLPAGEVDVGRCGE